MPSVEMITGRTELYEPEAAADDLCRQFGSVTPKLVVLFASRDRDQAALNKALRTRLPGVRIVGASAAGEVDRDGLHSKTAVAAAMSGDFEVGIGLGRSLSRDAAAAGEAAIRTAARELGARADDLASKKYVAIVIDDGFQQRKEELLLGVMSMNQALIAVGGGASDSEPDPSKASAMVHADAEVVSDAVVVALFRTEAPWAALRSHWYVPTGQTLRVTKLDATAKRAIEIDDQPAAKRYAELLGIRVDELDFIKPKGFATRPTALRAGREYFIRAPVAVLDDGTIQFANMIEEGSELELVKITDCAESTRRFFEVELPARVTSPRAMLIFHCFGRAQFAHAIGQSEALSKAFASAPTCAGLNSYFEIYCGFHINTTLTALAFGAS